jgi:hypothetical protein
VIFISPNEKKKLKTSLNREKENGGKSNHEKKKLEKRPGLIGK